VNRPSRSRAPEHSSASSACTAASAIRRATGAGFTLIELMVVVLIISIVCVLAVPSLSHEGYERRAYTDAASVAELVREARTRAVARGAAELLVMTANPTGNSASFALWEANTGSAGDAGPATTVASSCNAPTVWPSPGTINTAVGGATATFVDGFQIAPTVGGGAQTIEGLGNINMRINDPIAGTPLASGTNLYLCFTPAGRTWYSEGSTPPATFTTTTATSGALASLCSTTSAGACVGAVTVDVTDGPFPAGPLGTASSTNLVRTVWIPPSGATRITSQ
jgi:prepilin-type N-terminal cleavage/methylation domain-containing protein